MAFQLVGEVIIDGRRGTIALKDLQREATKTSKTFDQAGTSTHKLGKTLLQLGANAGSAHSALHSLGKLGAAGLFAGAVATGINKFGESVKKASEDYYQSRKALNDAFEQSFKSTSVEDAQSGIKKTEDAIESLRGKLAQLAGFEKLLVLLEKLTGVNFGLADTKKTLADAQALLEEQKKILAIRKMESEQIKKNQEAIKTLERISAINKLDIKTARLKGGIMDENVSTALEDLRTIDSTIKSQQALYKQLTSINEALQNKEAIEKVINDIADSRVKKAQAEFNLLKAQVDLRNKQFRQIQDAGAGVLGATKAGQQALENARKVRKRQVGRENYLTAESIAPTQAIREQIAARQAAAETPSLAEQIVAGQTGISPEQIAVANAKGTGGKNLQDQLLKAIQDLAKKLPAAVAQ
jgi:hypothetical protein